MASTPIEQIPSDGIQNKGPANLDVPFGSFRRLINCRLSAGGGRVEQTPSFFSGASWTPGTYWDRLNGVSATETSSSTPSLLLTFDNPNSISVFSAGAQGARFRSGRIKIIKQVAAPTMTLPDPHKGCLATFVTYGSLSLGGSLDVVIDSGTTFKWRINGGAYTTLVPIAVSVVLNIDITLFFLPTNGVFTGYTVNDTWSWQRTDALMSASNTITYAFDLSYTIYSTSRSVYFIGNDGQVMLWEGVNHHIRSVGYRPIYGSYLEVFENHLIVLNSSDTPATGDATAAWSDLNDFDNFIATDTNEADTFTFPRTRPAGNHYPVTTAARIFIINSVLFVDIFNQRWATSYLGLPSVFSFKQFIPYEGGGVLSVNASFGNTIKTRNGIYSVEVDGIFLFNGGVSSKVSSALDSYFQAVTISEFSNPYRLYTYFVFGAYNPVTSEVWFLLYNSPTSLTGGYPCFLIYNETTQAWHVRSASFSALSYPTALAFCEGSAVIAKPLGYVQEDLFGEKTSLVFDSVNGTAFQTPIIELQDLSTPSAQKVKEIESCYLDAYYPAAPTSAYAITGVTVTAAYRTYADAPSTPTLASTWTTAKPDGILSWRIPGSRIYRFLISPVSGNAAKPTFGFTYNRFVANVLGIDSKEVRK